MRPGSLTPRTQRVEQPTTRLLRSRRRIRVVAMAILPLALALGFAMHLQVSSAHRRILADELRTMLGSCTTSLEIWLDNRVDYARITASHPAIRTAALACLAGLTEADRLPAGLTATPVGRELDRLLRPTIQTGSLGTALVDPDGYLIFLTGSESPGLLGSRLSAEGLAALERLQDGEQPFLTPPAKQGTLLESDQADSVVPSISVWAPILDDQGKFAAALVQHIDPRNQFSRLLTAAWPGLSGEAYAFDAAGRMISESRFVTDLQEIGLLPPGDEVSAVFRIRLRDPGGDLGDGFEPERPAEEWPRTRMAEAALAGYPGVDVEGYAGYRGVEVIGAWEWLADHDLGIAVEIDRAEAYRPLNLLATGRWILFGLLALAAGWVVWSWRANVRLQHAFRKAQRYGQYTLERLIGEGGAGEVWKARHARLKRPTALKLLKEDALTAGSMRRFEQEVQLTSQLSHPNTIAVYDFGRTPIGQFYYAMEYLDGWTLADLLERDGAMPPGRVVNILRQLCSSLLEAHEKGLVHRDIKPGNIMLCERSGETDFVKVLDFGLVKDVSRNDVDATAPDLASGTPRYVAPERLKDPGQNDQSIDIYSVGVVAWELLTGTPLFGDKSATQILARTLTEMPEAPSTVSGRSLPEPLERLVLSCLAKEPDQRPASMAELLAALGRLSDLDPWTEAAASTWWSAHRRNGC